VIGECGVGLTNRKINESISFLSPIFATYLQRWRPLHRLRALSLRARKFSRSLSLSLSLFFLAFFLLRCGSDGRFELWMFSVVLGDVMDEYVDSLRGRKISTTLVGLSVS
jgi:hypothetical protein